MEVSKLNIAQQIADTSSDEAFTALANVILQNQLNENHVFKEYVSHIHWTQEGKDSFPFLPIELFKRHVVSCKTSFEVAFKSSGTTGNARSTHYVYDKGLYELISRSAIEAQYGKLDDFVVLALLPSYLENGDSSLVYMVDSFISASAHPESQFILDNLEELPEILQSLKSRRQKTLLFGVSYALLDYCETHSVDFPELIVMETGGMKGRGKELTRTELHRELKSGFPNSEIHSEYGMTELLSQAYSSDGKYFAPPPWMKAFATEISDPFRQLDAGQRGLLAFIDLANVHSCAFIQTRDIGMINDKGHFTVEGRLDSSDLRGCNLLYT